MQMFRTDGKRSGGHACPDWARVLVGLMCCASADFSVAQATLSPSAVFIQIGTGDDTHQFSTGLTWDWDRQWSVARGQLTGHWELSLSGWSYPSPNGRRQAWLGQLGVVPTLRYRPGSGTSPWFAEFGVGASAMTTLYETRRKRFSTSFNFADHVAVGHTFGTSRQHELALRLQHYSNAGIKHPNPGQNFVEIRYAHRFQ